MAEWVWEWVECELNLTYTIIGLGLIVLLVLINQFFLAFVVGVILVIVSINALIVPSKQGSGELGKEFDSELKTISDNAGKNYPSEGIRTITSNVIEGTTNNIYNSNIGKNEPMIGEPIHAFSQGAENFLNGLKSLFKK